MEHSPIDYEVDLKKELIFDEMLVTKTIWTLKKQDKKSKFLEV